MAVTPGSAAKINKISGVAKVVSVTAEEVSTSLVEKVFEKGILLQFEDGKIYITDGVTKLSELTPMIDSTLTEAEKGALEAAFSTGSYVAAAGGVVVHGAGGKIDDASLNVVADGKIVDSYLSAFYADGKIKLESLPDTVRAGVAYFATYAKLISDATDETKKGLAFVIDATDDPSGQVKTGSAMYAWDASLKEGTGDWLKIAEHESLDIDVESLTPNYENVQAAGAVMYDHTVMLDAPTLTELSTLIDASA